MRHDELPDSLQRQLSEFIAQTMGLDFPPQRWDDLRRGLAAAIDEFGFRDVVSFGEWLVSASLTKTQLQALASYLTVGETYFLRERKTFEVLRETVLPELLRTRKNRERRLRIWCAACCTGEEAYSISILLHQVIPDIADWHITILATDINGRFLQKAVAGVYGEWSFRGTPTWFKERYFKPTKDGRYQILPEIKKLVTFSQFNLVEDAFPSLVAEINAMDMIFCRNVLMYFSPPQTQKVIRNLHGALINEGWLIVSPSEGSHTLFTQFAPVNFPGVILYQKQDKSSRTTGPAWPPALLNGSSYEAAPSLDVHFSPAPASVNFFAEQASAESAVEMTEVRPQITPPANLSASLYDQGRYEEVVNTLLGSMDPEAPNPRKFSLLANAFANLGKLEDALLWCDRWIDAAKLESAGYHLRAVVLQELGNTEQARVSLQQAIYLHPDFVLAHFALGNIARSEGKIAEATRHFANASHLLGNCQPNQVLPESGGLTAGRLNEMISSLIAIEVAP
jgi:chemotaxis protein methyltransferase CheR